MLKHDFYLVECHKVTELRSYPGANFGLGLGMLNPNLMSGIIRHKSRIHIVMNAMHALWSDRIHENTI